MFMLESPKSLLLKRARARKKFLRFFKNGFQDKTYLEWERDYKWNAHKLWKEKLNPDEFERLLNKNDFTEVVKRALAVESKTNLLFSFEKMALRDAVKSEEGAECFALGLFERIYGDVEEGKKFERFTKVLNGLPRIQTRVLTWPVQTVFPFIAKPTKDIFLKPKVTQQAAGKFGFYFKYSSKPNWDTYQSLLDFANAVKTELRDLRPRDMIDIQSFIWVIGSEEYG